MICEGVGGSLELREDGLVIRRTKVMELLSHEFGSEKRIPYSSILAVQFRRAGVLAGSISIVGGVKNAKGHLPTIEEADGLNFSDNEAFETARDLIESRVRDSRDYCPVSIPLGGGSAAERLAKLVSFLEMGLLTQKEFSLQKAALLNAPSLVSSSNENPPVQCTEPKPDADDLQKGAAMDRAVANS